MHPTLHVFTVYRLATLIQGEGAVFRHLAEMRGVEAMTAAELERRQGTALARVLSAAYATPFYREHWGVPPPADPERARVWLADLPLLAKRHLQEQGERMRTPFAGRTVTKSTGGSTAEPVKVVKDGDGVAREMAASWMAHRWFGVRPGDRAARFWGTPLTRRRRWRFLMADLAMNRIRFSAFRLQDVDMERCWQRCLAFRPRWLYGYATLIDHFAGYLERTGRDGRLLRLAAVVPTSEPLSAEMRERIALVFGAPIQDEYGCGEVGPIAYTCERGALHVMGQNLVVEVLGPDGAAARPGETGEVVLTDLTNRAQPLVRYRLGDLATPGEPCGCGRPFPTLGAVHGRAYDVLHTPAGRRWHGEHMNYLLSHLFRSAGGFRQYQVVQDGPDHLQVRLVADADIPAEVEARIHAYVAERLDGMRCDVRRVEAVERSPGGKLRVVRNDWLPARSAAG